MTQGTDQLIQAFRDYVVDGIPSTGEHEPVKADIRTAANLMGLEIAAAQAGIQIVATVADMTAFYATVSNRDQLVYVNNNNGSASDAANGVYEYVGGARIAEGFYAGVASVVQPLVDEVQDNADLVADAVDGMVTADTLGIEETIDIPLKGYPQHLVLIKDESDRSRVVRMVADDPEASNYPGASTTAATLASLIETGGGITGGVVGDKYVLSASALDNAMPGCFLVWFVALSQSQSTTSGGNAALAPTIPAGMAFQFLRSSDRLVDLSSDADGAWRASYMPAWALAAYEATGLPSIFINRAVGGSAQLDAAESSNGSWGVGGTLRASYETFYDAAMAYLDAQKINYIAAGTIMTNFEREATAFDELTVGVDAAAAKAALLANMTWHDGVVGELPYFHVRLGRESTGDTAGYAAMRAVQEEIAAENRGRVHLIHINALNFPSEGWMDDNVHWSQAGKNDVGLAGKPSALIALGAR